MRYALTFLLLTACGSVLADGVVPLGDTYYFTFNTVQPSTGAPFTMGGTPAIEVYEEGTSTPITAGDTFTEDFNSVTGLHHVALACTGANGYEAGKWYSAVVAGTTPTVDSVSVAGMTVARFRVVVAENVSGTPAVDVELIEGTAASSSLASAADIVNEWETQSQADPTGFHVNVMEVGGTAQTANDNGADINSILVDTGTTLPDKLLGYFQLALRSDIGIATDRSTELAEINNNEGSGSGDYANDPDSLEGTADALAALVTDVGSNGTGLTSIPWNAAWDTEVQSEATDALNAYDPPTNTELNARTIAAATYATQEKMLAYFQLALRSDIGIATDRSTELAEINDNEGSGSGDYANDPDGQEAIADALAVVDGNVDDIELDTNELQTDWANGGRLDLLLDTAAAGGGGGGGAIDMQSTTIATLASQTSFTLTAGSADDDAYPAGSLVFVTDQSTSTQKCVGLLRSYTGATKTVTLAEDPGIFTMATGDTVDIVYLGPPKVRGN